MSEEQSQAATAKTDSYFESAGLSVVMPVASFIAGLATGEIFGDGHAVFTSVILVLAFGFGLSIFSIIRGFYHRMIGSVILGSLGVVLNGGCLYYVSVTGLFFLNLHC
jgi:hypothetical protein